MANSSENYDPMHPSSIDDDYMPEWFTLQESEEIVKLAIEKDKEPGNLTPPKDARGMLVRLGAVGIEALGERSRGLHSVPNDNDFKLPRRRRGNGLLGKILRIGRE